jgi:hypothetical protein
VGQEENFTAANASYEFMDVHAFIQVSYARYSTFETGEPEVAELSTVDGRQKDVMVVYEKHDERRQPAKYTVSSADYSGEIVLKFR